MLVALHTKKQKIFQNPEVIFFWIRRRIGRFKKLPKYHFMKVVVVVKWSAGVPSTLSDNLGSNPTEAYNFFCKITKINKKKLGLAHRRIFGSRLRIFSWAIPASFSFIFVFSNKHYNFYNKYTWKNVHPVNGSFWTHDLKSKSLFLFRIWHWAPAQIFFYLELVCAS